MRVTFHKSTKRNSPEVTGGYFSLKIYYSFTEVIFKAGKINTTTRNPGLFACEKITFAKPFSGGKQVKVFASSGNSVNSQTRGNGAAIWVESVDRTQFRACIYEYSNGSNTTAEINWIALQSAPPGAQLGTTSLGSWTSGTECKKIYFPQVSLILKIICSLCKVTVIDCKKEESRTVRQSGLAR